MVYVYVCLGVCLYVLSELPRKKRAKIQLLNSHVEVVSSLAPWIDGFRVPGHKKMSQYIQGLHDVCKMNACPTNNADNHFALDKRMEALDLPHISTRGIPI